MSPSRAIALAAIVAAGNPCGTALEGDRDADALQERGMKALDAHRDDDAATALRAAFDRHVALGDQAGASIDARLLSRAHRALSRYTDALRWAETARVRAVESGDEALLGRALAWLGDLFQIIGDDERAIEIGAEAALHLPDSDRVERATMKIYRARYLDSLGQSAEPAALLEEARDLGAQAGRLGVVRSACINLAGLALHDGRLDDAERHLRDARAAWRADPAAPPPRAILVNEALLARERGDLAAARAALAEAARGAPPDAAWPIARHRGIIAESEGSLDEAEGWYREAVTIIERMRASSAPNEVRAPFFEKRWEPFELLFELQLERGNARDAFATFAQAHGRMFLDTFAVSLADARSASPDPVQGAIHRVDVLEQMIPLLARSRLGGRPSPESILAALRDRHVQHLLAYFAGAGRMRLLSVMGGEPRITSVDIELERLDRLIDDFRARPDDGAAAAALGAALLPPDALPATPGRLHVVPTGPLMRVAFAALEVGGERLVERHEIAYLPSVTGLAAMADERGESAGPGVVIADSRSDLRSAARELDAVVARTGATPRTGAEATPEAFRAAATAPLLHVISHSGLDRRGGYLLLGDRKVTAAEILDWRIRPHLAVLPTCASAATVRSEMWDSLAAAFLAAGSAHVVATLASVEDQVAADFTLLFYLHGGLRDPVGATARAQREMARTHRVAAWSAFVAAGL